MARHFMAHVLLSMFAVVLDDANKDAAELCGKLLGVGFGVLAHHEARYGTDGFVAA